MGNRKTTLRENQHLSINDDLDTDLSFLSMSNDELSEGTSTYKKFNQVGEVLNAKFMGIEHRNLDEKNPDKQSECAILINLESGERLLVAQTVLVKELKKKWDETGEVGFPTRIIYTGNKGEGSSEYQSFRIFFKK